MKRIFLLGMTAVIYFQLVACQAIAYGTAEKLNNISIGMTKEQVVKELGNPDTTRASDNQEVLIYKWMKTVVSWAPRYFYVRLVNKKVQSFGEESELESK